MSAMVRPLLCAALFAVFATSLAQQPQVTTFLGSLKGSVQQSSLGRDFYAFEGVPYAKPPVGKHRFKQPIAGGPWTGILNATKPPPMCMQLVGKEFPLNPNIPFDVIGSEDCLYLNVYTPKLPTQQPDDKLLDVIVEIHGGGFQMGSGLMNGPAFVLDRDVVLVTINYRVGILGFLSFEDAVVPGNNGHKDQSLALQWVNKHIAAFGGDPNKVTIAGLSSGGASVHSHMISPMSKGLFQKVISNSGSMANPWAIAKNPRQTGLQIAGSIGCPTNDTQLTLKCLRERTAEQIVSAVETFTESQDHLIMAFAPVIELPSPGAFMDKHPVDLIKSKAGSDVPALFSYAEDEGSIFIIKPYWNENRIKKYEENWDEMIPGAASYDGLVEPAKEKEVSERIRKHFLGDKKIRENLNGYTKLFGERYFDDGIQKASLLHAKHQSSPIYLYKFTYQRPKGYLGMFDAMFDQMEYKGGAIHGEDNSYIFVYPFLSTSSKDYPDAHAMRKTMTDVWFKFIQEDPVANWSTVDSKLPQLTFLDISSSDPRKNGFKTEDTVGQKFWDSLNLPEPFASLSIQEKSGQAEKTDEL